MMYEMNDRLYEIEEIEEDILFNKAKILNDGKSSYFGMFVASEGKIYINKDLSIEQKKKTLMHELMHCYMFSYCCDIENITEEDLCRISSNAHNMIEEIKRSYFEEDSEYIEED